MADIERPRVRETIENSVSISLDGIISIGIIPV